MGGFASSRILEVHGERMIKRTFNPVSKLRCTRKISTGTAKCESTGAEPAKHRDLPELFNTCAANGGSQLDHSALVQALELMANHKLA